MIILVYSKIIELKMNFGPKNGEISIDNFSGISLESQFTVQLNNFVDLNSPLSY